jgi:hypothetical protein
MAGRWYLLFGLIWLDVLLALLVYRHTNPQVSHAMRRLLMTLRLLALLTVLLALFESRINFSWTESHPPLIAVVIDQSASMATTDSDGPRQKHLERALRDDLPKLILSPFVSRFFRFDGYLHSMSAPGVDSLRLTGDATNISQALQSVNSQLREQNLTAMLLFTDGNYNEGGNPSRFAKEMDVPVFCIGIGSSQQPADLTITDINANPFAYTNEATPIQIMISSVGYRNIHPVVTLSDGNEIVASSTLSIAASPSEQSTTLNYVAKAEGRRKLVVRVSGQPEELAQENNSRTLYMDVLKSRLLITLLAGSATTDISFFTNALAANPRYRLQTLVQRKDGVLYDLDNQKPALDSLDHTDILVLMNYPTNATSELVLQKVEKSWNASSRPLLLITGRETDFSKLSRWQRWLAIRTETLHVNDFLAAITPTAAGQNHPVMQIPGSRTGTVSAWNLLPPIWVHHRIIKNWPNSEVLAVVHPNEPGPIREPWPFIVVRSDGMVNSAAILGSSLWHWSLMMAGIGNEDELYVSFVNNLIRWLQMDRKKELINLMLNKTSYHFGEPVNGQIKVFDARFNPVTDAQVTVVLQKQGERKSYLATPSGDGQYQLTIHPESPGDYVISVAAQKEGRVLGSTESLFSVGEYSMELSELFLQKELLQNLSSSTGGRYVAGDSLLKLQGVLPDQKLTQTRSRRFDLWNHPYLLLFIIACLTTEWWLRKWKGMV